MNRMAEEVDIDVLLETGINKECRVEAIHDKIKLAKVNKMIEVEKQ